jgi:solute carrier family 12 (sodium/potassium/chloride transporter), member 2
MDALQGSLFPPNLVVVDGDAIDDAEAAAYLQHCRRQRVGLALFLRQGEELLGRKRLVRAWLSDRSPDWTLRLHQANLDLPVLVAWLVGRAWGGVLQLGTVVRDEADAPAARAFLRDLADQARLPAAELAVWDGAFQDHLGRLPPADLSLFGMPPTVELARLRAIRDAARGSCLFLLDSGTESALA